MRSHQFEASAPGRLDVMGGIADYSGSLVLQMPIAERTTVQLTLRDDHKCNVHSLLPGGEKVSASFDFRSFGNSSYEIARNLLRGDANHLWAGYVIGCVLVLQKEKGVRFQGGDFNIQSDVPLGKGVSSSAALEVATMKVLEQAFGITFSGTELAVAAQKAENLVVGAPCGLMDQLASNFGSERKLLPILCQPDRLLPLLEIPKGLYFMGIDSGVRHSVGGSSYTDVRCSAFMGYSIIAQALGISTSDILHARQSNNFHHLPFNGYLCNIPEEEFEERFVRLLPEVMSGKDFLHIYKATIDSVTSVNADTIYSIRNATVHPVYENGRVKKFAGLMQRLYDDPENEALIASLGELMYQSHYSYSACGLGSERTDEIVELAKSKSGSGIYGAKITGGGGGGTVCLLGYKEAGRQSVSDIHRMVSEKYGEKLVIFDPVK